MDLGLQGKRALITGASKGIGRADDVLADMNLPFGRMARAGYISGTIVTVDGGGVHRNH